MILALAVSGRFPAKLGLVTPLITDFGAGFQHLKSGPKTDST